MKNEYQVTWELYRAWAFENMIKRPQLHFMIYWSVFSILTLCLGFLAKSYICFLLAAFCIYRAFFRPILIARRQYKMMAERYGEENWTRTIQFGKEKITLTESNLTMDYPYADIKKIRENGDKLYLDLTNKTVIRLYKNAFVGGDWERCREMLERKRTENTEKTT